MRELSCPDPLLLFLLRQRGSGPVHRVLKGFSGEEQQELITVAFEDMLDLKSKGLRFSGPIAFRQECWKGMWSTAKQSFLVQCMILCQVTKKYLSSISVATQTLPKTLRNGSYGRGNATNNKPSTRNLQSWNWALAAYTAKMVIFEAGAAGKKTGNTSFSLHIDPLSSRFCTTGDEILWMFNLLARREVHPQQLWEIKSMKMCHWFTYQTPSSGVKNMFESCTKTIRFYNFYHMFTVCLLILTVSSIDTFSQEKQNKTLAPTRDTLVRTNISPCLSPCLKAFLRGCSFSPSGISQFTGGYLPPCTFSDSACAASARAAWSCSWGFHGWVVKGSLRKPKKHGVVFCFEIGKT